MDIQAVKNIENGIPEDTAVSVFTLFRPWRPVGASMFIFINTGSSLYLSVGTVANMTMQNIPFLGVFIGTRKYKNSV